MKLTIRLGDAPTVPGGKALYLCDDQGKALPSQRNVSIEQGASDPTLVTVIFVLDGEYLSFSDEPETPC